MTLRRPALALIAAAALILPLAACSAGGEAGSDIAIAPSLPSTAEYGEATGIAADGTAPTSDVGRSVIRNGDIAIEVDDPAEAAAEVGAIAEDLDGYVESESLQRGDGATASSAYLLLRVPAEHLDEAFDRLGEVGTVISQSRSASDVTAQHVDLQARVRALEESVARLTELMSGAATTGELIEAETALSQRQQELDGLRAQLTSLEGQVDQAGISVQLGTQAAAIPGGPANFWEGLVAGWHSIVAAGAGALVLLGVLLPWIVVLGAVAVAVVLIVRARRRARRRTLEGSDGGGERSDRGGVDGGSAGGSGDGPAATA